MRPGDAVVIDAVVLLAQATGFFSVWMEVFRDDPSIRNRLIDAFPGTRDSGCFDPQTSGSTHTEHETAKTMVRVTPIPPRIQRLPDSIFGEIFTASVQLGTIGTITPDVEEPLAPIGTPIIGDLLLTKTARAILMEFMVHPPMFPVAVF
ncbi:MAG: hypothetical protein ACKO68_08245 [Bacteroidota bacterium]